MQMWMNEESTILIRINTDGSVHISTRPEPDAVWGPWSPLKRTR